MVASKTISRKDASLLLTQRQYVAYKVMNELLSREEALAAWNEDYANKEVLSFVNNRQ